MHGRYVRVDQADAAVGGAVLGAFGGSGPTSPAEPLLLGIVPEALSSGAQTERSEVL